MIPVPPFERLTREQRAFWCRMAGSHELNGRHAQLCVDVWSGPGHFEGDRERAILEVICWIAIAREAIGLQGFGHA